MVPLKKHIRTPNGERRLTPKIEVQRLWDLRGMSQKLIITTLVKQ